MSLLPIRDYPWPHYDIIGNPSSVVGSFPTSCSIRCLNDVNHLCAPKGGATLGHGVGRAVDTRYEVNATDARRANSLVRMFLPPQQTVTKSLRTLKKKYADGHHTSIR